MKIVKHKHGIDYYPFLDAGSDHENENDRVSIDTIENGTVKFLSVQAKEMYNLSDINALINAISSALTELKVANCDDVEFLSSMTEMVQSIKKPKELKIKFEELEDFITVNIDNLTTLSSLVAQHLKYGDDYTAQFKHDKHHKFVKVFWRGIFIHTVYGQDFESLVKEIIKSIEDYEHRIN